MATCVECGFPLKAEDSVCPECGCPVKQALNNAITSTSDKSNSEYTQQNSPYFAISDVHKTDWAQYFYENAVIGWEACKKYFTFTGRASRREYWSFWMLFILVSESILGLLIMIIPLTAVSIRRMHDVNKCGWWILVPFASFFLCLKKSDEESNYYGDPEPAKNLL